MGRPRAVFVPPAPRLAVPADGASLGRLNLSVLAEMQAEYGSPTVQEVAVFDAARMVEEFANPARTVVLYEGLAGTFLGMIVFELNDEGHQGAFVVTSQTLPAAERRTIFGEMVKFYASTVRGADTMYFSVPGGGRYDQYLAARVVTGKREKETQVAVRHVAPVADFARLV